MSIFTDYNINLTAEMEEKFGKYTELITYYNTFMNLTAITEKDEIYVKHYLDSLLGAAFLDKNSTVIDVGSGAGFPAIPLKIYRPDLKITMLDSLNKRVNFLKNTAKELDLTEINAVHLRAEDAGKGEYRERYDYAVARAVADMSVLSEYTLPFIKIGGKFVAYKGEAEEELKAAENALKILGGIVESVEKFTLPDGSKRSIIIVKKIKNTPPKYPRGQNKPRISPL